MAAQRGGQDVEERRVIHRWAVAGQRKHTLLAHVVDVGEVIGAVEAHLRRQTQAVPEEGDPHDTHACPGKDGKPAHVWRFPPLTQPAREQREHCTERRDGRQRIAAFQDLVQRAARRQPEGSALSVVRDPGGVDGAAPL
jgi:hypothetical protein